MIAQKQKRLYLKAILDLDRYDTIGLKINRLVYRAVSYASGITIITLIIGITNLISYFLLLILVFFTVIFVFYIFNLSITYFIVRDVKYWFSEKFTKLIQFSTVYNFYIMFYIPKLYEYNVLKDKLRIAKRLFRKPLRKSLDLIYISIGLIIIEILAGALISAPKLSNISGVSGTWTYLYAIPLLVVGSITLFLYYHLVYNPKKRTNLIVEMYKNIKHSSTRSEIQVRELRAYVRNDTILKMNDFHNRAFKADVGFGYLAVGYFLFHITVLNFFEFSLLSSFIFLIVIMNFYNQLHWYIKMPLMALDEQRINRNVLGFFTFKVILNKVFPFPRWKEFFMFILTVCLVAISIYTFILFKIHIILIVFKSVFLLIQLLILSFLYKNYFILKRNCYKILQIFNVGLNKII